MSRENVEIARVSIEAVGTSDFQRRLAEPRLAEPRLAETWYWLDPEIEWDTTALPVPDISGLYRGLEGVRRFWEEWFAAWETLHQEYELIDAGDRVVQLVRNVRLRGRSTGIEVSPPNYACVSTWRDGLMVHWKMYMSHEEALEAVGLRE